MPPPRRKMTCKCGNKQITRMVGAGGKGKSSQNATKLAKMSGAKKVAPKKVAAKKTKGTPCKCTNPFKGGN